jgi:hypothetical protein
METIQPGDYEEFIERLQRRAARDFHRTAPLTTQQSVNMLPQHGMVIGAMLDDSQLPDLFSWLRRRPAPWSIRNPGSIYACFGMTAYAGATPSTRILGTHIHAAKRIQAAFLNTKFGSPALIQPRIRVSSTEIVLHGLPNKGAFHLRNTLLGSLEELGPLGIGNTDGRIVLAEATRPLKEAAQPHLADDHTTTNEWLASAPELPAEIQMNAGFVSVFNVDSNTFRLADSDSKQHAAFAIS